MTKKTDAKPEGKRNSRAPRSVVELNDLKSWLTSQNLGIARNAVHVNGRPAQVDSTVAIVTVDLGQGLKQARLTSEQAQELSARLVRVGREVLAKDVSLRVRVDNSHGVHWVTTT